VLPTDLMSKRDRFTHLPIVDVSGLNGRDFSSRQAVSTNLAQAARNCGFFYVTGHGLPSVLMERLRSQAEAFFALTLQEKMQWYIGHSRPGSSLSHRGYVPEGEEVFYGGQRDRKEAFDLGLDLPADDPEVLRGTPMLGPNVWPAVANFKEDVAGYYDAALSLGKTLFRGFALALGLPESHFDSLVTRPPAQLRLIHYPCHPDAADQQGIGAHTDYECFTILASTAPGLEVMNGAGEWIDAPPVEGAFIVNIGDMMEIWTNGEFVATSHRVRRVREERYSFPLFCVCDYYTQVEPLPAFVTGNRPARYPSLVMGEHLFAQTMQSFQYLRKRRETGDLVLHSTARPLSSFGQQARIRSLQ
jgi:isopenicillin N synthase-like dioxygenase